VAGINAFPPTFAKVSLPDQSPQHVGAVVAVGRTMERFLREEMAVSGVQVDSVVPAGHLVVVAVVRYPDEIRCARNDGPTDEKSKARSGVLRRFFTRSLTRTVCRSSGGRRDAWTPCPDAGSTSERRSRPGLHIAIVGHRRRVVQRRHLGDAERTMAGGHLSAGGRSAVGVPDFF